jgi:hypothetical protein
MYSSVSKLLTESQPATQAAHTHVQPTVLHPWHAHPMPARIEVIFENEGEGKAQVIVAPLVRLTNRKNVAIEDIGPPEGILTSLGPFITGERGLLELAGEVDCFVWRVNRHLVRWIALCGRPTDTWWGGLLCVAGQQAPTCLGRHWSVCRSQSGRWPHVTRMRTKPPPT